MVILAVCTALYDYTPQSEHELEIKEGDLLYIVEKSGEDGWWKAKKKPPEPGQEEPIGLIPNNYVEDARSTHRAKALYDYTRQTDEEVSFEEEAVLTVYDKDSDPDWTLVGFGDEFGFAPANYIELLLPAKDETQVSPPSATNISPPLSLEATSPSPELSKPSLPRRPSNAVPTSPSLSPVVSPLPPSTTVSPQRPSTTESAAIQGRSGFRMFHVNEMASTMGKSKKLPTTLGVNLATGVIMIIADQTGRDRPQEWTADKLTHYSIEGKHVFVEMVKPSRSADFHAGQKDTAQEIVSLLGEIAGTARAGGLREILEAAGSRPQRTGKMLYDFVAQGDDEVTVGMDDQVIILDDSKSEEWWQVRRLKNGQEGVVPSSYVEITGTVPVPPTNAARSVVEQNRLEEQRLAKEAVANGKIADEDSQLPERGSSRPRRNVKRVRLLTTHH